MSEELQDLSVKDALKAQLLEPIYKKSCCNKYLTRHNQISPTNGDVLIDLEIIMVFRKSIF